MFVEERQRHIVERVRRDGRVDAGALADDFDVTPETIRRDLGTLERQGLVKRTRGGAIAVERLGFEPAVAVRSESMVAQKERIVKAALEEIPDEGAILLDAGTTVTMLTELIPHDRRLTVVTNSLTAESALVGKPNVLVMMLGGRLRSRSMCHVDEWTIRSLHDVCVDVAFMGTNGLTIQRGLTTSNQTEASVKGAMMNSAHRVVVLADHSKVGTDYFHRFGDLSQVDVLVTDSELDPDLHRELTDHGVNLVLS